MLIQAHEEDRHTVTPVSLSTSGRMSVLSELDPVSQDTSGRSPIKMQPAFRIQDTHRLNLNVFSEAVAFREPITKLAYRHRRFKIEPVLGSGTTLHRHVSVQHTLYMHLLV